MVPIEVLIGEVHVKILAHMHGPQDPIEERRFVEDLMSNHKSQRVEIGEEIKESNEVEGVPKGELEIVDVVQNMEEEVPIDGDGGI